MLPSLTDCFECLFEIFDRVGRVVDDFKALLGAFALVFGGLGWMSFYKCFRGQSGWLVELSVRWLSDTLFDGSLFTQVSDSAGVIERGHMCWRHGPE